ncbi:hypothetical protein F4Z98_04975 [Candidatus Poribacteria bacterium]|nr:hypothetical protein [Candidatus Poribacteria bacterium]MYC39544.1 hypothetical protein [Candidatus Dadabacteria bacterium]
MIIGRLEDYIERIKRDLRIWQRQDATLQLSTGGASLFVTALYESIALSGADIPTEQDYQEYPDEVFVELQKRVSVRDPQLKQRILAYYEKHDPRAKAAAAAQLTLFYSGSEK